MFVGIATNVHTFNNIRIVPPPKLPPTTSQAKLIIDELSKLRERFQYFPEQVD